MRQQVLTSSRSVIADRMKWGRNGVVLYTADERIDVPMEGVSEDLPRLTAGTEMTNVACRLNGSGDILYGFHPAKGSHIVTFLKFSGKAGEVSRPRLQTGGPRQTRDGRKWNQADRMVFTALLEIMTGDFKGCVVPFTVDYIFERDVDGSAFMKGPKRSMLQLGKFLELAGFDMTSVLRWSENVLPDLEMLLSEAAETHPFQISMMIGHTGGAWVDDMSELPAGLNLSNLPTPKAKAPSVHSPMRDLYPDEDEPVVFTRPSGPARKPLAEGIVNEVEVVGPPDDEDETLPPPPPSNRRAFQR